MRNSDKTAEIAPKPTMPKRVPIPLAERLRMARQPKKPPAPARPVVNDWASI